MIAKGTRYCLTLLLGFAACAHVNSAKMEGEKRDTCVYTQHTNGCSTPITSVPYRNTFTPACKEHDVCYSCGERYRVSRGQCDSEFKRKMYEICDSKKRFWQTLVHLFKGNICKVAADTYYGAVYFFGRSRYENPSPSWCEETCVQNLMDDYYNLMV